MTGANNLTIVAATGSAVSWRTRPRVEKTSHSNQYDGERRGDDKSAAAAHDAARHARLSQIGTAGFAPRWNGPRLMPAFVAQVLGQMFAAGGLDARSALAAYRDEGTGPVARAYDERA